MGPSVGPEDHEGLFFSIKEHAIDQCAAVGFDLNGLAGQQRDPRILPVLLGRHLQQLAVFRRLLPDHAVQSGPNFEAGVTRVRLYPISGTQKIILLAENASGQLRYSLWTGNTFLGDPAILLESSLASSDLPFDIAESGAT